MDGVDADRALDRCVWGVLLLQRGDRRIEDARRAQARAHADDRERELSALAQSPNFSLNIYGASGLWLSLPIFLSGCALLAFSVLTASIEYGLVGAGVLAAGTLLLAGDLPILDKPVLSISARGLESPVVPFLPWSAIEGVHLRANPSRLRDEPGSHTLLVRVPSLPDRIARFGLFHRILFRLKCKSHRERFHIVLRGTSEPPAVIYRLLRQLLSRSTGWEFDWDPDMSDAYNAALRQLGMPRENARTVGLAEDAAMSLNEANRIVVAELARRRRMLVRLTLVGSVLFLLYLLSVVARLL